MTFEREREKERAEVVGEARAVADPAYVGRS